jgi:hypothetical protein
MEISEILKAVEENKSNNELLDGLKKFVPEKIVEKEKELSNDVVEKYVNEHQSLQDKIYNNNTKKFLTKKLGREATDQDLGAELVLKTSFDEMQKGLQDNIKNIALQNALGDKYELLKPHINMDNLKFENNTVAGVDDVVNELKNKFASVFADSTNTVQQVQTVQTQTQNVNVGGTGMPAGTPDIKNPYAKDTWNIAEQNKLIRENRELAYKFMIEAGFKPYGI